MIVAFPHPPQNGGPGTFQRHLETIIRARGSHVVYSHHGLKPDVIVVVGGTRKLRWLRDCREAGAKILHRLDGRNWRHRLRPWRARRYVAAEIRNSLMGHMRQQLADFVVYQSEFCKEWWYTALGPDNAQSQVIYNGTDFFCDGRSVPGFGETGGLRVVSVEGQYQDDPFTRMVVRNAVQGESTAPRVKSLEMYGAVPTPLKGWLDTFPQVMVKGQVPRTEMQRAITSADVFLSLEVNPSCPNAVIEAMGCGLPILAYDTGALQEIVNDDCGVVLPYDADPWRLELPSAENLHRALAAGVPLWREKGVAAARRAREAFHADNMGAAYLKCIETLLR